MVFEKYTESGLQTLPVFPGISPMPPVFPLSGTGTSCLHDGNIQVKNRIETKTIEDVLRMVGNLYMYFA
jgi:hypothetical protein